MNRENWPLVADEPVEFDKQLDKGQDFKKITIILEEYIECNLKINEEKTKRSQHVTDWTWKHEDFDRLGPKISPDTAVHCLWACAGFGHVSGPTDHTEVNSMCVPRLQFLCKGPF